MVHGALLDVDGTLIDNNLLHVLAWRRAFQRIGRQIDAATIVRCVGMGADRLVPAILGEADEATQEAARAHHAEEYVAKKLIDHAEPAPGARALLGALRARGARIALASSARREELDRYLPLLGGAGAVDACVVKEQVASTKPAPDIFARAIEALGKPPGTFVVGDTVYDVEAAKKLGLPCVCVLTGGIERALLEKAGAAAIYDDAAAVAADLDAVLALARRTVGSPA